MSKILKLLSLKLSFTFHWKLSNLLRLSKISQILQETKRYLEHKLTYLHGNEKIICNKKLPENNFVAN